MKNLRPKIKLMADYGCWPLWGGGEVGNLNPELLPLSAATQEALGKWAQAYDLTLNRSDPIRSGFETLEAASEFNVEGWRLWDCLRKELTDFKVVYFDNELGEVFEERPSEVS